MMTHIVSHLSAITVGALANSRGNALVGRTYPRHDDQRLLLKDLSCTQVRVNNILCYRSFHVGVLSI